MSGEVVRFPKARPASDHTSADEAATTSRGAIGEVLRDERHAQDRTLADVADRAAVSLPYLSEVERGRKDVSSELLAAICDALELPLPVVFERAADRLRAGGEGGRVARTQLLAA